MLIREIPTKTLYWVTVMPFAYIFCGFQQVTLAELSSCNRDLHDLIVSLGLKNLNCLLSVLHRNLPTLLDPPPTSSPASFPLPAAPATLTSSLFPQCASLRAFLQLCPLPGVPSLSSSHFLQVLLTSQPLGPRSVL